MLIAFISNIQSSSSHLYYMTPVFSCENMDYKVHEDEACSMMDFCTISTFWIIPVDKGTITAELGIYCGEKKDQRTLLQSAAGIGNLFGIVFAGTISDRKGRKLCFCIGIILYTLTCLRTHKIMQSNSSELIFTTSLYWLSRNSLLDFPIKWSTLISLYCLHDS